MIRSFFKRRKTFSKKAKKKGLDFCCKIQTFLFKSNRRLSKVLHASDSRRRSTMVKRATERYTARGTSTPRSGNTGSTASRGRIVI